MQIDRRTLTYRPSACSKQCGRLLNNPTQDSPAVYGIKKFITLFTKACHLRLCWARWTHSTRISKFINLLIMHLLQFPVPPSFLGPIIFLSMLFSNTLILFIYLMPETKSYTHIKQHAKLWPCNSEQSGTKYSSNSSAINFLMHAIYIFLMSFPDTSTLLRFKRFTTDM